MRPVRGLRVLALAVIVAASLAGSPPEGQLFVDQAGDANGLNARTTGTGWTPWANGVPTGPAQVSAADVLGLRVEPRWRVVGEGAGAARALSAIEFRIELAGDPRARASGPLLHTVEASVGDCYLWVRAHNRTGVVLRGWTDDLRVELQRSSVYVMTVGTCPGITEGEVLSWPVVTQRFDAGTSELILRLRLDVDSPLRDILRPGSELYVASASTAPDVLGVAEPTLDLAGSGVWTIPRAG